MPDYIITEPAQHDLREIMEYLSARSSDAPKRVREKLRHAMGLLAEFPGLGHTRADVITEQDVRFWCIFVLDRLPA